MLVVSEHLPGEGAAIVEVGSETVVDKAKHLAAFP